MASKFQELADEVEEGMKRANQEIKQEPNWIGSKGQSFIRLLWDQIPNTDARIYLAKFLSKKLNLIKTYFDFFTEKINKETLAWNKHEAELFSDLIKIVQGFTDASTLFAEGLGTSGILDNMFGYLKKCTNFSRQRNEFETSVLIECTGVVLNCSIPSKNTRLFTDDKIDLIRRLAKESKRGDLRDSTVYPSCMIILAHVSGSSTADIHGQHDLIEYLVDLLSEAMRSEERRTESGFSAMELALGLSKLARDNANSVDIVRNGALSKLAKLMQTGKTDEKTAAVKCVWALAFDEENKSVIRTDASMVKLLKSIANNKDKELKKSASGALFVLGVETPKSSVEVKKPVAKKVAAKSPGKKTTSSKTTTQQSSKTVSDEGQHPHVMISYNWDHQPLLIKVKDHLESQGYKVWMDVENMRGNILDSMTSAVQGAAVVLVCMSQQYEDSHNCRTEGVYAYDRKKDIVPLKLQSDYKPNNWLGGLVACKLYFDFSNGEAFKTTMAQLISELGERGKSGWKPPPPQVTKPKANTATDGGQKSVSSKFCQIL